MSKEIKAIYVNYKNLPSKDGTLSMFNFVDPDYTTVYVVSISSPKYWAVLAEKLNAGTPEELDMELSVQEEVTLYEYAPAKYSLLEGSGFGSKNNLVQKMGTSKIVNVETDNQTYASFHLEDGTIARRNFTTKMATPAGEKYLTDPGKKVRMQAALGVSTNLSFDFNTLVGGTISYYWTEKGQNIKYFELSDYKA